MSARRVDPDASGSGSAPPRSLGTHRLTKCQFEPDDVTLTHDRRVTSEITHHATSQDPGSTSEIRTAVLKRGRGALPTALPVAFAEVLADYATALSEAPLAAES
ncbi:MAG: hypothetical protein QOE32_6885, partial [Pseudonocardiales bacterium]|nr:hypothetical protein [Pseudonocardiales bacterium]